MQRPEIREQWHYLFRPGQGNEGKDGQSGKEECKETFLIQHLGRKQFTLMSATSLPRQFDFEVSLTFSQDQMSGRAFFSCEICTQGLTSVSAVKSTLWGLFHEFLFCKSIRVKE